MPKVFRSDRMEVAFQHILTPAQGNVCIVIYDPVYSTLSKIEQTIA